MSDSFRPQGDLDRDIICTSRKCNGREQPHIARDVEFGDEADAIYECTVCHNKTQLP